MRDLRVKRDDHAEICGSVDTRILDRWIANPLDETITVLVLAGDEYVEQGVFVGGDDAGGVLSPGFAVDWARYSTLGDGSLRLPAAGRRG